MAVCSARIAAAGFRFAYARGRKGQVRMRINEARHHHPARGVDLDGIARLCQILQPPAGSHFRQDSILDEQGAVVYYVELFE